ncbi:hypothetical protein BCR32DRAFT_306471 [Anaeromyces robustus]|uniref:P-loop containing nucleoside triphosphate hydrolase protein n=1 Tax=Anaeromyces robustus TaxID=1754192 RepID=A0A1Y1VV05_9FUNG|nr:hypothetical protein BCR32DRAFT_306471 [Anaeromyces robustus]|eukprot:ORX64846.1 hypothetical protein BCR32DRAFT_306471 [Anaeromyces robustus]
MSDFIFSYPSIQNINEICNFTEFRILDDKIAKSYQEIVYKYISPYTPYNKLLLYHSTGLGKTFTIFWIIDHFKNIFDKAIILAPNDTIIGEYFNKIKLWYHYNFNSIDESDINNYINNYIIFNKYSKFIKINRDKQITNRIIVVDEIHKFRISYKNNKKKKFKLLLNIINKASNIKLLLLSASPIYDNYNEIDYILKLLNIDSLNNITPYVSYYNKSLFKVPVHINYLKLFMSDEQSNFYLEHYNDCNFIGIINIKNSLGLIYNKNNILIPKKHYKLYDISKINSIKFKDYDIQISMTNKVNNNLKDISIKLYTLVNHINTSKGLIFIYCNLLEWTGIYYIVSIFNILGYVYIESKSEALKFYNKLKYTFVIGDTNISSNNIDKINLFNSPENKYGDYIKILIGSNVISESIDLLNVQQIHILTPEWNYEHINQIIGRANRINSHNLLKPEEQLINVYFYLAYPKKLELSQDDKIINICKFKQKKIDKYINEIKNNNIEQILNNNYTIYNNNIYALFYNNFNLLSDYQQVKEDYISNIDFSYCNGYVYKYTKFLTNKCNNNCNLCGSVDHINHEIDYDEFWEPPNIYDPIEKSIELYYNNETINHYNNLNNLFSKYKNNLINQFDYIEHLSYINRVKVLEYALYVNKDNPYNNNICKYFNMYWIVYTNKIIHCCYSIIKPTSYAMNKNKSISDFMGKIRVLKNNNVYWKEKVNKNYSILLYNHYINNKNKRLSNRNVFAFIYSLESIIRIQDIININLYNDNKNNKNKINRGRRLNHYYKVNDKLNIIIETLCIENIEHLLNKKYLKVSYYTFKSLNNLFNNPIFKTKIDNIKKLKCFKNPKIKDLKTYCIKYPKQARLLELIINKHIYDERNLIAFWNNIILENNLLVIL